MEKRFSCMKIINLCPLIFAVTMNFFKIEPFFYGNVSLSRKCRGNKKKSFINELSIVHLHKHMHVYIQRIWLCASTGIFIFRDWIALKYLPTFFFYFPSFVYSVYFSVRAFCLYIIGSTWDWRDEARTRRKKNKWRNEKWRFSVFVKFIRWKHKIYFYVLCSCLFSSNKERKCKFKFKIRL